MNFYTTQKCIACNGKGRVRVVDGAALRERRNKAGLTLAQVGKKLGFSKMYCSDLETGRRRVTEEIAKGYLKLKPCK